MGAKMTNQLFFRASIVLTLLLSCTGCTSPAMEQVTLESANILNRQEVNELKHTYVELAWNALGTENDAILNYDVEFAELETAYYITFGRVSALFKPAELPSPTFSNAGVICEKNQFDQCEVYFRE